MGGRGGADTAGDPGRGPPQPRPGARGGTRRGASADPGAAAQPAGEAGPGRGAEARGPGAREGRRGKAGPWATLRPRAALASRPALVSPRHPGRTRASGRPGTQTGNQSGIARVGVRAQPSTKFKDSTFNSVHMYIQEKMLGENRKYAQQLTVIMITVWNEYSPNPSCSLLGKGFDAASIKSQIFAL
ncbi:collagen alpha-2(V) chain-like [Sciurus carolinensis]|uniref:collagen alpha-2(V) chain-like n=1 Tax=Sciurus carolinensis TaxID=30640 RepID=UPI001FB1A8C8|nr:collagen alpha-2(V) chain-like [Sciurus carolinensis]